MEHYEIMTSIEILDIIGAGETSKVQFKREFDNQDKIADEMIAFSNSKGGMLLFGVEDKSGKIIGLNFKEIQVIGNKLATIANELVKPLIYITTEVVIVEIGGVKHCILVAYIDEGLSKPYKDNNGTIWLKQGADKRRVTDNAEILRLFQKTGVLYVDEMTVPNTSEQDIDVKKIEAYIRKIRKNPEEITKLPANQLYKNLNILRNGQLTLGGLLFFAKDPQRYKPVFCMKAVAFYGNSIGGTHYRDSRDIVGTIPEMFDEAMRFFKGNLRHVQAGQNFKSVGILEISEIALEEILQNALIHRDYTKNASIRLMIFDNRIEIVSPGCLPDSLTVESIKLGNATVRNNLITSFCSKLMSYRGFGSGIIRAVESQPNIEMENDEKGEQFIIRVFRDENLASLDENVATSSENLASSSDNLDSSEGNFGSLSAHNIASLDSIIGSSCANNIASSDSNIGSSEKNKNKKRLSKQEFEKSLLNICASYTSLEELARKLDRNIDYLKNFIIPVLLKDGKLERLYPDTPNHPKQKYRVKN
jgi:predicted HTH transcriptional regulator